MPRGDGTGPMGAGPMTGRAAGYCAGYSVPGYANPTAGFGGYGRGFGQGRGRRNWFQATGMPGWQRAQIGMPAWGGYGVYPNQVTQINPEQEAQMLKSQVGLLQNEINAINKRLEELDSLSKAKE